MIDITEVDDASARQTRWGAFLVGIGAAATLVAIVLYLTSGAVTPADASVEERAEALAGAADQVALMAYLSIPAGVAMILGPVLLAIGRAQGPPSLVRRVAWISVVFGTLLILQFDLLMPHLIIPLADRVDEAPLVFETVYRTSDYVHSVGLVMNYVAFLAVFWTEARTTHPALPRWVAHGGAAMWSLGLVVGIGLVVGRPLFLVAPAILVGWALLSVLGFRMAARRPDARDAAPAQDLAGA